jgi:hypothetical protein
MATINFVKLGACDFAFYEENAPLVPMDLGYTVAEDDTALTFDYETKAYEVDQIDGAIDMHYSKVGGSITATIYFDPAKIALFTSLVKVGTGNKWAVGGRETYVKQGKLELTSRLTGKKYVAPNVLVEVEDINIILKADGDNKCKFKFTLREDQTAGATKGMVFFEDGYTATTFTAPTK